MHILDKALMKVLLKPQKFYEKMGVDNHQLLCVLMTKLEMDDRVPSPLMKLKKKKVEGPSKRSSVWFQVGLSLLMGFFLISIFGISDNEATVMTVYFSAFLFMLISLLLSGLSSILLDKRDNYIILPKPVNSETVTVARVLQIIIRVALYGIPMMLPGIVATFIQFGIGKGLAMTLMAILGILFSVTIVNIVYLFLLKYLSAKRFQSIMGTLQIVTTIAMYLLFQLIPRMLPDDETIRHFDITTFRGISFFPPYWFAVSLEVLGSLTGIWKEWLFLIFLVGLVLGGFWYMIKFLAPAFNKRIAESDIGEDVDKKSITTKGQKAPSKTYSQRLASVFTKKGIERSSFRFAWTLSSKSKEFKMKVYPFIGYVLTYVLIFTVFRKKTISLHDFRSQSSSAVIVFLSLMYSVGMLLFVAFTQMSFFEKFKASWIYYTTPIEKPGVIVLGAAKALLLKFLPPFIITYSVVAIYLMGWSIVPNIVLAISNVILLGLLTIKTGKRFHLPFSAFEGNERKGGDVLRNLFRMVMIFILGWGHFLIYWNKWAVLISLLLSIAAVWYLVLSIRDVTWDKIEMDNIG